MQIRDFFFCFCMVEFGVGKITFILQIRALPNNHRSFRWCYWVKCMIFKAIDDAIGLLDNKSCHFRIELLSTNVTTNRTIKHQHEQFVMEWQVHGLFGWVGKQLAGDIALFGQPQVCLPTFFILEQIDCEKPVDLCCGSMIYVLMLRLWLDVWDSVKECGCSLVLASMVVSHD